MLRALSTRSRLPVAVVALLTASCGESPSADDPQPHFPTADADESDAGADATGRADVGADEGAPAALCPTSLTSSGELDLALQTATLTGTVTFEGASIADSPDPSGGLNLAVELVDVDTGALYPTSVDPVSGEYEVTVFTGQYDVSLVVYSGGYYQSANPRLGDVVRGLVVEDSATRDFDLTIARITGTVTVNGAPMPESVALESMDRGYLGFENVATGADRLIRLASDGPATYNAALMPGTYRVTLTPAVNYTTAFEPLEPTGLVRGPVDLGEVTIAADARVDFDATTLRVSGTVEGAAAWMAGGDEHGVRVDFYDPASGRVYYAGVDRRNGTYALDLVGGDYQVSLRTRRPADPPYYIEELSYPLCDVSTDGRCRIRSESELDWRWPDDSEPPPLDRFTVRGEVTINGAQMPNNSQDGAYAHRATLRFYPLEGGLHDWAYLGNTGPAEYEVALTPNLYRVTLESHSDWDQDAIPPGAHVVLAESIELTSGQDLDFDATTAHLVGEVLIDGDTMPDDSLLDGSPRGAIRLVEPITGWYIEQELGETGPAEIDFWLFVGVYDVVVSGYFQTRIIQYYRQDVLPSSDGVFAEDIVVSGTTHGVFDRDVIEVTGELTINGDALTDAFDLESVALVFVDATHGIETTAVLANDGYFVRLYAGEYLIELRKAPNNWQPATPLGATRVDPRCDDASR